MTKKNTIQSKHSRNCVVCGELVHFFSPYSAPVCFRAQCKFVLDRKKHMSEASYKQFFSLQSTQIKQTIELAALRKRQSKENIAYWKQTINHDYGYVLEQYPYVVVVQNPKKLSKLSKHRRDLFKEHLSKLICETMPAVEEGEDHQKKNSPQENVAIGCPFEARACSICNGWCCYHGKEHAYLKKETLVRFMTENPEQKAEQVLAAYMGYLPEKSFEGSCLNHTVSGCSLPINMRSHVCNDYICDSLIKLRTLFARKVLPKGVLFIIRAKSNGIKNKIYLDNSIIGSMLVSHVPTKPNR